MNDLRRILSVCALALFLASPMLPQPASLVRDIATGPGDGGSALPGELTAVGDKVVFTAREPSSGREVWGSDGSPAGTHLLQDTAPGPDDGSLVFYGTARGLVFWGSRRDAFGNDLWRSDGTRRGTLSLMPPGAEVASESPGTFAIAGDTLYFLGCPPSPCILWRSDGTSAGTRPVPGAEAIPVNQTQVIAAGNRVFVSYSGPSGNGLWISDGTAAGTRAVSSVPTLPRLPIAAGGRLFFIARAAAGAPEELWTSDGTAAGTRPVTDFGAAAAFGRTSWLRAGTNGILFLIDGVHGLELWTSDGTPAGTRLLTPVQAPDPPFGSLLMSQVAEVSGRALFLAPDPAGTFRLWTASGGSAVQLTGAEIWSDGGLTVANGHAFLFADDGAGFQIWTSDGTPAGTRKLTDFCRSGTCGLHPGHLEAVGDRVYFAAGGSLWRSDGTAAGTQEMVAGIYDPAGSGSPEVAVAGARLFFFVGSQIWVREASGESHPAASFALPERGSSPRGLLSTGGRLWLTACDGFDRRLWRTTAASDDVEPVSPSLDPCRGNDLEPARLFPWGNNVFFARREGGGAYQLWRTDGTAVGTVQLTSFPDEDGPQLEDASAAVLNGKLLFSVRLPGPESLAAVWETDGTPAGTQQAFTVPSTFPGAGGLTTLGNTLYFYSGDPEGGSFLWRSDGTAAGTRKLAHSSRLGFEPPRFVAFGGAVYFTAESPEAGEELWRTNGAGASLFFDAVPGPAGSRPSDLTVLGPALYFLTSADDSRMLWRTDGTAAGTVLLHRFPKNAPLNAPIHLTAAGARLFFAIDDGAHGIELWTSNGTPPGTVLVSDLARGAFSSFPESFAAAAGRLYFVADDRVHGFELWTSDGTAAGTRLVHDIAPEGPSSRPDQLQAVGDRLYFTADDGVTGRELWSLSLTGSGACRPSPHHLCLNGGRYQVETAWRTTQGTEGRGTAVPLSADTGYFWFFSPTNVEAIVKVLDGRGVNGHIWVFYGALSDVEYSVTVTDTQTGLTRRYLNPQGQLASVGDTSGFGPLGAYAASPGPIVPPPSPPPLVSERTGKAAAAPCQAGAQRLCLSNNRFTVEVAWKDFQNHTGKGTAVPLTGDTGTFWFFNAANTELVIKILDGRPVNGKFWLFYGALSNVEYTLTVTDIQTGTVRTYTNPSGRFASVADTNAF